MHAYSDPARALDPHALPDIEVFHVPNDYSLRDWDDASLERGWYWWSCFPGCLPDSDPEGPYETEAEALASAQAGIEVEDEDQWWEIVRHGSESEYAWGTFAEVTAYLEHKNIDQGVRCWHAYGVDDADLQATLNDYPERGFNLHDELIDIAHDEDRDRG